jgi:hypothetical protein
MAGQKLTDKTALGKQTASGDVFHIVDVSDTTGSSAGTSKKVSAKYVIQTDKIEISNAEYKALNSTEKVLVAAPGTNKIVMPLSVAIFYTQGATANTNGTTLYIGFKGIGTAHYWDFFKQWTRSNANVSYYFTQQNSGNGDATLDVTTENQPFIMWLSAAPTATATGTAKVFVTYQIVDVS